MPSPEHQSDKTRTTFIIVKETREISRGRNPRTQAEFTMWQIIATKPDGTPIPQNLRCFEDLPRGEVLEVSVTPFVSEQWGTSYTIARKNKSKLHTDVSSLEDRVARIEAMLNITSDDSSPAPSSAPPPPPSTPITPPPPPPLTNAQGTGSSTALDDIPF